MQTGLLERAHELERIDAFLALAQADSGDILLITGPGRANQRTAAREPLREGLDLAYRCGAGRLTQRAMDELRATGARPRRPPLPGLRR